MENIPQGFDEESFAQFKSDVQTLVKDAGLPDGKLLIHGSRVKGTAGVASDIDIILRVDKKTFEKFAEQRIASVHKGTKLQKTLIKAAKKGKLSRFDISRDFSKRIEEHLVPNSPVKKIDFSIIIEGAEYDTGPFIPLGGF